MIRVQSVASPELRRKRDKMNDDVMTITWKSVCNAVQKMPSNAVNKKIKQRSETRQCHSAKYLCRRKPYVRLTTLRSYSALDCS